jgi:hypothetical protein
MKKKNPKAHNKTQTGVEVQTGAGHKKQTTLTQNISRRKIPTHTKTQTGVDKIAKCRA